MNLRKELYKTIGSKLNEIQKDGKELFELIDLYKGQFTSKENIPAGCPAAFISISRIKYVDMTLGAKHGNATVKIYLFFDIGSDSFIGADDIDESLEATDIVEDVAEKLEALEGDFFSELSQSEDEDLTERYRRPAYAITFETVVYKRINKPKYVLN